MSSSTDSALTPAQKTETVVGKAVSGAIGGGLLGLLIAAIWNKDKRTYSLVGAGIGGVTNAVLTAGYAAQAPTKSDS